MLQHRLLVVAGWNPKSEPSSLSSQTTAQTTSEGWTEPLDRQRQFALDYTTVQTVLSVVSNRTALASVGFMLVSYIGFSKDACPLELSWPT